MLSAKERRAKIEAYETAFLVQMEEYIIDLRCRLAALERRLARAKEQKRDGETMTAALLPEVVRALGLADPFGDDR